MSSQGLTYNVDLVLCIDGTGSMSNIIERVKQGALKLEGDFQEAMREKDREVSSLRVKVIVFRDVFVDGDESFMESEFFQLPEEADRFASFVNGIRADGGGDEPESGLEALATAMRSRWEEGGDRRRHVIVVWTDAPPHPLELVAEHGAPPDYPPDMPRDFNELTDMWQGQTAAMSSSDKRLVLFAPDSEGWNDIDHHWDQVVQAVSRAGEGLAEHDYRTILSTIAESVG